jgi:hypothetical protein
VIRVATWRPRIETAPDEAALLALMNEYCSIWLPSDLARLPIACQECFPSAIDDIPLMAVTLKQEDLMFEGDEELRRLLHELAGVFGIAAERLRSLRSPWRSLESS